MNPTKRHASLLAITLILLTAPALLQTGAVKAQINGAPVPVIESLDFTPESTTTVSSSESMEALGDVSISRGHPIWNMTYGGEGNDWANSIVSSGDGGYVAAGATDSYGTGKSDAFLMKVDSAGELQWSKTYGGQEEEEAYHVIKASAGGYLLAGVSTSYMDNQGDMLLTRVNEVGNVTWVNYYYTPEWDEAHAVAEDADGGFVAAGLVRDGQQVDVKVIKVDFNGTLLWSRTYGGSEWDEAHSIVRTGDGCFMVAGYSTSFGAEGGDIYLLKIDASGDLLWEKTFGGSGAESAFSMAEYDGDVYVSGFTTSGDAVGGDAYLLKVNSTGALLWDRTYGGSGAEAASSVIMLDGGDAVLAGYSTSVGRDANVYMVRVDPSGEPVWEKTYKGSGSDIAWAVIPASDFGYYVGGVSSSNGAGEGDVLLARVFDEYMVAMDMRLYPGWNQIGVPAGLVDNSMDAVFGENLVYVDYVYRFNNQEKSFDFWINGLPDNQQQFTTLESGKSYWVHLQDGFNYTMEAEASSAAVSYILLGSVSVEYITGLNVQMYAGWNQLGVPMNLVGSSLSEVFGDNLNLVEYIYKFDNQGKSFSYWIKGLPDEQQGFNSLESGEGYWVYVSQDVAQTFRYY